MLGQTNKWEGYQQETLMVDKKSYSKHGFPTYLCET